MTPIYTTVKMDNEKTLKTPQAWSQSTIRSDNLQLGYAYLYLNVA